MRKSILLVEDNQKLANFIKNSLVQAGCEVEVEGRGDKAAYRIVKEAPDLVVLDIMLPEMDGKQICHTVRDEYRGKILMLTALNDIESEVSSLNLGADDYLAKPVAEAVLIAHIAALFRRPDLSEPVNQITLGALYIDLIKKIAYLNKKEIELKPTDFELLLLLAKNADYTLNRDNIMYALRGREYDGVDRSIDLRISHLRKKLRDDVQKPYKIKSVHGKGYIFISSAWDKT
ncbi:MAG: response regulator [Gammaproteobacteria bacterium]|nr:response regulator [Gammaproteobacteria bacterium]